MPGTKTAATAAAAIDATADTATEVTAAAEAAAAPAKPDNTVTLDFPIKRGAGEITEITLRKPMAGELRGVKLTDLLTLEAGAVRLLLPRVTVPTLLPHEVDLLDPADFTELATMVAGFFVRKSTREALLTA